MRTLKVHRDAMADLDAIPNRDVAAKIIAFLQEAKSSPEVLDTFTAHGFGTPGVDAYNISKWQAQQQQGRNLWRAKLFILEDQHHIYRIVYAFDAPKKAHYVLGVARHERRRKDDFDYQDDHPFTRRVTAVYDRLAGS